MNAILPRCAVGVSSCKTCPSDIHAAIGIVVNTLKHVLPLFERQLDNGQYCAHWGNTPLTGRHYRIGDCPEYTPALFGPHPGKHKEGTRGRGIWVGEPHP